MLKIVSVYQIIIWLVSLAFLVKDVISSVLMNSVFFTLLTMILAVFSVIFIYVNVCVLFECKIKYFQTFLKINLWTNFLQIFHLSLLGVTYYIAIGLHILIYYSYGDIQEFRLGLDYFQTKFGLNFNASNMIIIGINLIPLLLFIFFNRKIKLLRET